MSDELAAAVASKMGPGEVDDLLTDAMTVLRERYPEADVHSVSVTFSYCERTDRGRTEREVSWRLQVDNETGHGKSRLDALRELRYALAATALVAPAAQRVAAVLREVTSGLDDAWTLDRIVRGAGQILEQERRKQR